MAPLQILAYEAHQASINGRKPMKTLIRSLNLGLVAFASVLCTPKALATDVSGTLSSDTVWSAPGSPYVMSAKVGGGQVELI